MKRVVCLLSGCLLVAAVAGAQGPPQGPVGTATGLQRTYAQLKNNLTLSAEKMPEADYFFKPTPDIRGYGQLWAHVADAQFGQCSGPKGVTNPRQGQPSFETDCPHRSRSTRVRIRSFEAKNPIIPGASAQGVSEVATSTIVAT